LKVRPLGNCASGLLVAGQSTDDDSQQQLARIPLAARLAWVGHGLNGRQERALLVECHRVSSFFGLSTKKDTRWLQL
jgi:hypothetical protein